MTALTTTVEEFLTQVEPDEEDQPDTDTSAPLESIAASLRTLTEILVRRDAQDAAEDETKQALDQLDHEYAELNSEVDRRQQVIDDILDVCAKSRGQLAEKVRAVVDAAFSVPDQPPVDDGDRTAGGNCPHCGRKPSSPSEDCAHPCHTGEAPPVHDADVEAWRAFAEARGGIEGDLQQMNRSQIRTALGISHVE